MQTRSSKKAPSKPPMDDAETGSDLELGSSHGSSSHSEGEFSTASHAEVSAGTGGNAVNNFAANTSSPNDTSGVEPDLGLIDSS